MVPLTGYVDRISGRPGDRIEVKVSSQLNANYHADFVRIIHADPNPDGPGMKLEPTPCSFAGEFTSRSQAVVPGSYGVIEAALAVSEGGAIQVRVQPGLLARRQPILALGDTVLLASAEGAILMIGGHVAASVPAPMLERCPAQTGAPTTTRTPAQVTKPTTASPSGVNQRLIPGLII